MRVDELKKFLEQQEFKDCASLCNKGKHLKLRKNNPKDTIVYNNALSGNTPLGEMKLSGGQEWILITSDGRHVDVLNLAKAVLDHWNTFLSADESNGGES